MMKRNIGLVWLLAALLCAGPVGSEPQGGHVVVGDVTIDQNPDGSVTVIHASDGSIIEYDSFDIALGELVEFVQPGADARVLNRVGGDATYIDGTLLANGIVYILNPAGVFLNGSAVIDVGGLVAGAGDMSNEDFVAGIDRFELTGTVVNASEDLRADRVALLGRRVENLGTIHAPEGLVALVAGERVLLVRLGGRVHVEVDGPALPADAPDTGIVQAGRIEAAGGRVIMAVGDHYSLAINHQGVTVGHDVELRGGDDGTLLVQGSIDASAGEGEQGGSIRVLGERVALLGASLDASGGSGGGEIRVGGDLRGGAGLPTARRTYVDGDSVLRADATQAGDGGSVVVWGDEAAVMAGSVSARGGDAGGDGGFVEVSSLGLLDVPGSVDLGAAAGSSGTFLLDPQDIVIVGGSADGSDDPDTSPDQVASDAGTAGEILFGDVGDGSEPFEIHESEIEGTDANIVLEARNSVTVSGTFDHDSGQGEAVGTVVVMDDNDLTIRTRNDEDDELGSGMTPGIDLGSVAWQTGGTGSIVLATGTGTGNPGASAAITVGDLSTEGGSITLATADGSITTGNLTTSGQDGDTGGDAGTISAQVSGTGDVTVGDVFAVGGEGLMDAGGNGGGVNLTTMDGAVSAGSVDASGGDGATDGGAGRDVLAQALDPDDDDGTSVVVGDVTSRGGEGFGGNGGNGGGVTLRTLGTRDPMDSTIIFGGGPVQVGNVVTSGGDGTSAGGNGGIVGVVSGWGGDVDTGDVTALGGNADTDADNSNGPERGGTGGAITIQAFEGDVTAGNLDSSGGNGTVDVFGMDEPIVQTRGRAARIEVRAQGDMAGNVTLDGTITAVDGDGNDTAVADTEVEMFAVNAIEFDPGVATPHIRTTERVELVGRTIGAVTTVEIDAVGLPDDPVEETRNLSVAASEVARVDVTTAGFDRFLVVAEGGDADIDVTQEAVAGGGDAIQIDLDGGGDTVTVVQADMRDADIAGGVALEVILEDDLVDTDDAMDDVELTLEIASGAVDGTGNTFLRSEDHVVLNDDAITMHPPADAPVNAVSNGDVLVQADFDSDTSGGGPDGSGAITQTGTDVAIDMNEGAGPNPTGRLLLVAAEGVGSAANPIVTANVDAMAAGTTTDGGVHVRNAAGGDVTYQSGLLSQVGSEFGSRDVATSVMGTGDVSLANDAGDLVIGGRVGTRLQEDAVDPEDPPVFLDGGDVTLAVAPGSRIRFLAPGVPTRIDAGGDVLLDGPVVVQSDLQVLTEGDVTFADTVDSDAAAMVTRNLTVATDGTVRFGGDVGLGFQLRNLDIDANVELGQDTSFDVLQLANFRSDVDAAVQDGAAMTVSADQAIRIGGNLGAGTRLRGVSLDAPLVAFLGDGAQSVVTGADGIALQTNEVLPAPSPTATINKNGDLHLESALGSGGSVRIGENHKLTVAGTATLVGDTVEVGDVSAFDLGVDSPNFVVDARQPGLVRLPNGALVTDGGTDIVANTISTTSAPSVSGTGPSPRFATGSGVVDGAGAGGLQVVELSDPVDAGDLVDPVGGAIFDYALFELTLENEVEPDPTPVDPLLPALPGDDAAGGSAQAPDAPAVWAFLQCSESASAGDARDCAPAPGSPLDSPRGEEIAERHRRLFGPGSEAEAARRLMGGQSAEARAVNRDLARLLAQLRLLGMEPQAYERVRDRLLDDAGAPGGREALLPAVRGEARGLPL